ncbi:proteasome accessory factor PafA2 family protein [Actinomycetaceae bacterium TAE3-ERU4]|nr:proteasome accessory factor PafA2 family protein [Actinomycetaceae bacterium TAE3-ERU4]
MNRRVFGLETEYGLIVKNQRGQLLEAKEAARELFDEVLDYGSQATTFLSNGARLYVDVGSHPEYATAECADLRDLIAQDRAGDEKLRLMAQRLSSRGFSVNILRNNSDSLGNSFGCHENYLIRRRFYPRFESGGLLSFLVTRTILVGAGAVANFSGTWRYLFSARAPQMLGLFSSGTTHERPLVNTRDQALADSGEYRRLHVICGDTNVAQTSLYLKVGSMLAICQAIESGINLDEFTLRDPIGSLQEITSDLSLEKSLELADGRSLSALRIQKLILSKLRSHLGNKEIFGIGNTPDFWDIWEGILDNLESGNWENLVGKIDWVTKLRLLVSDLQRRGSEVSFSASSLLGKEIKPDDLLRARRLDSYYHEITGSLMPALYQHGLIVSIVDEQEVFRALSSAPSNTRAALRAKLILEAEKMGRNVDVDWDKVCIPGQLNNCIRMPDPFAVDSPGVVDFINRLGNATDDYFGGVV